MENNISLLVVSSVTGQQRRYSINRYLVYGVLCVLLMCFFVGAFGLYKYRENLELKKGYLRLDAEKAQLEAVVRNLKGIEKEQESVRKLLGLQNVQINEDSEQQSRKDFRRQKAFATAQVAFSTAQAVTNALAAKPWSWVNAVNAITMGILGTAQTVTIQAQKYPYAKGGIFSNSVVNTPTSFNQGIMGEAGPEAIMPLSKNASGELGISQPNGLDGYGPKRRTGGLS